MWQWRIAAELTPDFRERVLKFPPRSFQRGGVNLFKLLGDAVEGAEQFPRDRKELGTRLIRRRELGAKSHLDGISDDTFLHYRLQGRSGKLRARSAAAAHTLSRSRR
jgi:hypothetical protein